MKKKLVIRYILVLPFFMAITNNSAQETPKVIQEEESAEVFLDEYTDEFQEAFFEAIKQKGIQNYDRAANLFLECKRLDLEINVVNHELAKTYLLDKNYVEAERYAIEAIIADETNYWYLDTLIAILEKQSNTIESIKNTIPYENKGLQKNLALIYYKRRKYNDALSVLKGLSKSGFKEELTLKIQDSLSKAKSQSTTKTTPQPVVVHNDPVKRLELNLEQQIQLGQFQIVESRAKEAVELYPLQPYFYYAYGLALHKNNKNSQAIDVLQSSLDYLFDNQKLANKIYQALSDAYTETNNISKANEYLRKIKPGF